MCSACSFDRFTSMGCFQHACFCTQFSLCLLHPPTPVLDKNRSIVLFCSNSQMSHGGSGDSLGVHPHVNLVSSYSRVQPPPQIPYTGAHGIDHTCHCLRHLPPPTPGGPSRMICHRRRWVSLLPCAPTATTPAATPSRMAAAPPARWLYQLLSACQSSINPQARWLYQLQSAPTAAPTAAPTPAAGGQWSGRYAAIRRAPSHITR